MSTNLFTAEQEAFLRNNGIDTSLPVFPLSCHISAKAMHIASIRNRYDHLATVKRNGGMASESEHKKQFCKDLQKENQAGLRFSLMIIALIFGEGLAWVLTIILMVQSVRGKLNFYFPKGSWIILHGGSIFIVYMLVSKLCGLSYLAKHSDEINEEMANYRQKLWDYERNSENAAEKYEEYNDLFNELHKLRKIISADRAALPQTYWSEGATFLGIYNDRRADNVSDAIAVYEDMRHKNTLEQYQARQTELANQANIAAQEALQTARNAQASASIAVGIANSNDHYQQNRY